jgi:putative transposase
VIDDNFDDLARNTCTRKAAALLGRARATHYRRLQPPVLGPKPARPAPANAMTEAERAHVLSVLRSEEFCDLAPAQVWARLLDDGTYLCSIATMYRLLRTVGESRERRRQRTHPAKKKPELMATGPNQVWSWDITKLRGPTRGLYYELFVIIDIYSRHVIAWTVAAAETGELAKEFIDAALASQGIGRGQLTLHADRGTSMTSKPVAQLLVDLGVARSHSRPHVSNDNPFSEAGFKTLKYCPAFPGSFGSIQDARRFCETFFAYYNHEHRHSGIGLREERARTLDAAYAANPDRFRRRRPTPPKLPTVAWINDPSREALIQNK